MSNQAYSNPDRSYWLSQNGVDSVQFTKQLTPPLALLNKGILYELDSDGKLYFNAQQLATGTTIDPAVWGQASSGSDKLITMNVTGDLRATPQTIRFYNTSSNVVDINTAATFYYRLVADGGGVNAANKRKNHIMPAVACKLRTLTFSVSTGAAWAGSGAGVTIRIHHNSVNVGNPIVLTPSGASVDLTAAIDQGGLAINSQDTLSYEITNSVATMDIINYNMCLVCELA